MMSLIRGLLARPFVRFLAVGTCNTMLSYVVYASFVQIGLAYWLANLLALVFGIGWSYMTLGRLVFQSRNSGRLMHFAASWGVIYLVQTGLIWLLLKNGVNPTLGGLLVLPPTAIASYIIQKFVVFRRPQEPEGNGPSPA